MQFSDEMSLMFGGTECELAVDEIRQLVLDARTRLLEAHPFFNDNNKETQ